MNWIIPHIVILTILCGKKSLMQIPLLNVRIRLPINNNIVITTTTMKNGNMMMVMDKTLRYMNIKQCFNVSADFIANIMIDHSHNDSQDGKNSKHPNEKLIIVHDNKTLLE